MQLRKSDTRAWEIAQWEKHLPHKQKDQSLIPRMRVKEIDAAVCVLTPALGRRGKVGPWGSKASQANLLGEFQASEKTCLKKRKSGLYLSENHHNKDN